MSNPHVIFRHLLECIPATKVRQIRLHSNLLAHLAAGRPLKFRVTPGSLGLLERLGHFFSLAGAVQMLYTGQALALDLDLPEDTDLPPSHPWLRVSRTFEDEDCCYLGSDGTLKPLPPALSLPPGRCLPPGSYPLSLEGKLLAFLARTLWGFDSFREGQLQVMELVLQGKNTLAIMPTGSGKSLCFQLPALLLPGITLVVSPLKSLMRDQIANLQRRNFLGIDFIDSSRSPAEKQQVIRKMRAGELKLLYLSPERLQIASFQQELLLALELIPVSLFAIDEAHCVSEWGHDFRPSYLRLCQFIKELGNPPVCALTATASLQVRRDIIQLLGLAEQDVVVPKSLDRPEISLAVHAYSGDRHQEITRAITAEVPRVLGAEGINEVHRAGTGLVFAPYADPQGVHTRPRGTVAIAAALAEAGLDCRYYHAKLADKLRARIQDGYRENQFPLLVATKGFGMGIDKADINYIIHACAPASLEAYYQEAGRAGRSGQHAHSLIITQTRHQKCLEEQRLGDDLPSCHQGWVCTITGKEKCDFGVQAGLLALEYPREEETVERFQAFLDKLVQHSKEQNKFIYLCPDQDGAGDLKYLYYLQQLGAVVDFRIMEYRASRAGFFDLLIEAELAAPDALTNRYRLTSLVTERIAAYKAQKLQMLNNVQIYLAARDCRRKILMDYFGDRAAYLRCNFCDIEGIDASLAGIGSEDRQREQVLRLVDELSPLATPRELLELSRGQESAVRTRAMRLLEDQPFHGAALMLAGILALAQPELAAFGRRNLFAALEQALKRPEQLVEYTQLLAESEPDLAAELLESLASSISGELWVRLAPSFTPPSRFPLTWLRALVPALDRINSVAGDYAAAAKGE